MTLRAQRNHVIFNQFTGVNDLVDEVKLPKDSVRYSQGLFFDHRGEARRMHGKLLVSTATCPGPVISIAALKFSDRTLIIHHASTLYRADPSSVLSSLRTSDASTSHQYEIITP